MRRFASRLSAVVFIITTSSLLMAPLVSAHVLKENNGISSVMHIDPDDNPVAGVPTTLDFEYGNSSGSFLLNDYEIDVKVTGNSKVVQTATVQPAYFGSASEGDAMVQFPKIGIYNVIETGKALNSGATPFQVTYLVRVATSKNGSVTMGHGSGVEVLLLSATGLLLLAMIAGRQISAGKKYIKPQGKGSKKL
jgi:hypothetical protein